MFTDQEISVTGAESDPAITQAHPEQNGGLKPLFIHSFVDDYGFTPAQFRVLCRVARRGDCFESVPSMAAGCHMTVKTARSAVAHLVRIGAITKSLRAGKTAVLRLAPFSSWATPGKADPTQMDTQVFKRAGTPPKRPPGYPTQKNTYEGNPYEVSPLRKSMFRRRDFKLSASRPRTEPNHAAGF